MFGFGNKKRLKFIEENRVSQEYHKYLSLGAILVDMNDSTSYVLNMRINPEDYAKVIEDGWGITDQSDLMETIESLIEGGGHREKGDEILKSIRSGLSSANYDETVEKAKVYKIDKSYFDACRTTAAWDIERVAFLARVCHHLGYIDETDTWNIMSSYVIPLMKEYEFHTWEDYAVSLVLGRKLCYGGDASDVLFPIQELLYNKKESSVWQTYSIADL